MFHGVQCVCVLLTGRRQLPEPCSADPAAEEGDSAQEVERPRVRAHGPAGGGRDEGALLRRHALRPHGGDAALLGPPQQTR